MTTPIDYGGSFPSLDPGEVVSGNVRLNSTWNLRYATVVATVFNNDSAVLGRYDGDVTQLTPLISLIGQLTVGDRVAVLFVPPSGNYVIGLGNRVFVNERTVSVNMSVGVTNSGAFSDIPGVSIDFIKKLDTTTLKATLMGSAFSTVATTKLDAGVNLDGTDYVVAEFLYNTALEHHSWSGMRDDMIGAIPAGSYNIRARWRRLSGTGVLTMDVADRVALCISEVPAP